MKEWLLLILMGMGLMLMLSCVPLSKEILLQVDPALTFGDVQKNPDAYAGKMVLWGGVIIEAYNKQQETVLKVLQTELDYQKRPTRLDHSLGRFLIRQPDFLDPAIYKEGREITVAGKVAGKEVQPLGNSQYTYPVVAAKELYLWEWRPVYQPIYPYPPWYYDPYYVGWPRYPYWGHPWW
jgi:outer membrane lipoprotein